MYQAQNGLFVDQSGSVFDRQRYSRFKFGGGLEAHEYGRELALLLVQNYPELLASEAGIVIASSPYKYMPTAAKGIADELERCIDETLISLGHEPAQRVKIYRESLLEGDYATLPDDGRARVMAANRLFVDAEQIAGRHVLIVDDIKITGRHEQRLQELLEPLQALSVWYLYAVQMDAEQAALDPSIETRLNKSFVRDLQTLTEVIRAGDFLLNSRVCKLILGWSSEEELHRFLTNIDDEFLGALYTGIISDGLASMDSYQQAVRLLQKEMQERDLFPKPVKQAVQNVSLGVNI